MVQHHEIKFVTYYYVTILLYFLVSMNYFKTFWLQQKLII